MKNARFTKLQAMFVCQRVAIEGSFEYALTMYSSYDGIKNKQFQTLRKAYCKGDKKAGEKLKKLILTRAGRTNFRYPGKKAWAQFSDEYVRAESRRWDKALDRVVKRMMARTEKRKQEEFEAKLKEAKEKGQKDREAVEASLFTQSSLTAPTYKNILS